ncbi:MAG TPA: MFS transporter, partial [Terriglobales bacterium]|nr:MFS transporter [Terriglobales bacterium]
MATAPVDLPSAPSQSPVSASAGPQPVAEKLGHPLAISHFRNLWLGSAVSLFGDQFYLVALPWLVLQLTGSSLALGAILMMAAVPRAALMLAGGALTDRFSPRRVLMATATARTLLVGAVAVLVWLKIIHLWHLYALSLLFGVADAFSFPAGSALMPTLVAPQQLPAANSVFASTAHLSGMLGPAPAGIVVKAWGIAQALFLDALSFLFVIAALWRIPEPARLPASAAAARRPSMLHSIREGLRYVMNDPTLRSLVLLIAALNFCVSGPVSVGLATMAKFRFASATAFGTLLSCFSGGALSGMLLAGLVKRPPRRGVLLVAISFLMGLGLVTIGLSYRLVPIALTLALMGVGAGFVNVQIVSWMQARAERQVLGRVMSVVMFSAVGLLPMSLLAAGAVAQKHLG